MGQRIEPEAAEERAQAFPILDLVPGWYFRVTEASVGQFIAEGTDRYGRRVCHQGDDPGQVLGECAAWARSLKADSRT